MTELQYNYVVPQEKLYSNNAWKHKENTEQDSEDYAMAQQRIKCTSKVGGESSRESIYGSNPVLHQTINSLCPENTELVKLLLHEFEAKQYTGWELAQLELHRNMSDNQLLACYGFDIQAIRERCSSVWSSNVHNPSFTPQIDRFSWMKRNCNTYDSDEFLYWTFILIQYDNPCLASVRKPRFEEYKLPSHASQQTPPFGTIHYGRSIRPIMRRDV